MILLFFLYEKLIIFKKSLKTLKFDWIYLKKNVKSIYNPVILPSDMCTLDAN